MIKRPVYLLYSSCFNPTKYNSSVGGYSGDALLSRTNPQSGENIIPDNTSGDGFGIGAPVGNLSSCSIFSIMGSGMGFPRDSRTCCCRYTTYSQLGAGRDAELVPWERDDQGRKVLR